MNSSNPKHGISGQTTLKESSSESILLSKKMDEYLRESQFFESEDAGQTRERALGRLDFLVKRFVEKMAPGNEQKNYGGKIFTFGSYRLGVHGRGADIDVLCVVPRHVSRKDFFTVFYEELCKDPNVSEVGKIEDAYVPLISLKYHDIPIDLTFARLNLPVIKENISLLNDAILKSMDEKCILSLNGSRVTDAMLHLVPNVEVFHSALRAIKFWGKRRLIYGNSYGYFGGVAFSISVARICQFYPNYCSYDIVRKFFELYTAWKWPTPVQLCQIVDHNYNLKVWDPKTYPADKYHRMPVITPAYPSICSTHNVTQSTSGLIISEFHRGYDILKLGGAFGKLFEESDFLKRYKMFVEIHIMCKEAEGMKSWEGYVESKIRILGMKLESLENIASAVPIPRAFRGEGETWFFVGIDVSMGAVSSRKVYIGTPIEEFLEFMNQWEGKTGAMRIEISSKKRKEVQEMSAVKEKKE